MNKEAPAPMRGLGTRLRLAGAALWWERVWPACWPALCVLGVFAVFALFDLLPRLPGTAHAAVLAAFMLAFAAAVAWGVRAAGIGAAGWLDPTAGQRRIERASGLSHRPLAALADHPSAPLGTDAGAAALWEAHQNRMAAAVRRRLRVGWPVAGLARHDPWGVRSVLAILLLLGAIDAGADWRDRFARAFAPNFDGGAAAAAASFDVWLTPPEYTGLAPQFLRPGQAETVSVPTGSVLLAQVHGGGALPRLEIDDRASDFTAVDQQNFRFETRLTAGKSLALQQGGVVLGSWPIAIVPDHPPTVEFARPPQATPRAALRLDYRATDDYGVEGVKAVIRRAHGGSPGEQIAIDLPLPGVHLKKAEATSYHDLTPHPWAGLPVEIRLVAADALGQTGDSGPVEMVLPERVFHNPIARAIIDQRKELAKDPNSAEAVAEILGDLNQRPALYRDDEVVFLALRLGQDVLHRDHGTDAIATVEKLLWDTALRVEDGNMSLAQRELRQLQEQLQNALAKGAPDAEISKLMQQLRDALDRYMQALAKELQRHPSEASPQPIDPSKVITSRDLERMLDRAAELARSGDRDQARELLSQLQNMLENLRTARPGQMQRGASQAQQMMRGLQDLMQGQQKLLDRSFRAQRQQGPGDQQGEPGQQQGGEAQPGQTGQMGDMADEAGQQEGLRRQLGDMMRRLGEGLGDIPEPFGRAERSMHDAAGALQRGQPSQAIGPQTDALDQLQQAAREFARQMQRRFGSGWGNPDGDDLGASDRGGGRGQRERDPLGRPTSSDGTYDQNDVKIPDDNMLQQSRRILDELRRRAGERDRPPIELDYIDRLLKRF